MERQPQTSLINQSENSMGDSEEGDITEVRIQIDKETSIRQLEMDQASKISPNKITADESANGDSSQPKGIVMVDADEENDDDDEEDFDDCIDIRDNANDEDQFAFEDNNGVNGVPRNTSENFPGNSLTVEIGEDNNDAQVDADDAGEENGEHEEEGAAAANRVTFADEDQLSDCHYDHHHIEDHFQRTHSESYEDDEDYQHGEKSLDVLLLEEICEEAASMTIKEALIHSLKPNVRAGLATAHLRLSESEILNLEGYCEDFVGGLIKDLLRRTSILQNDKDEAQNNANQTTVQATTIKITAKQLSAMDLKQLKVYCDHFVHNVIAESIIDSSMIVAKQQDQADQVKDILHVFQESDELQEYFTSLTTDIVRTALINVVSKEHLEEAIQSEETDPLESEFDTLQSSEHTSLSGEFESHGEEGFDFDDNHSFSFPDSQVQQKHQEPSPREVYNTESSQKSRSKRRKLPQQPGDTPLEFDMDWVEGALHDIGVTEGDRRHKIVMKELDFDDRVNARGNEVLAPVFLAIAEENEDDNDFQGMRRKTQSIEDLCGLIEEDHEPPRKRSSSLNQAKPKRKHHPKQPPPSFKEYIQNDVKSALQDDLKPAIQEDLEERPPSPDENVAVQAELERQQPKSLEVTKTIQDKVYHAYDDEQFRWHTIRVNNREKVLDLRLIEPYMKVITHGGVHIPSRAVIVVVAACYLPDKSKRNYDFLMEQLFFYLISTLELLATADEYFLVYLNGGTTQANMPALPWMKRFYQHIEGGLKQQMIKMFIVHPNFWLKTVVRFARAFVGTTFWSKLEFMKSLDDLSKHIPTEFMYIPDEVIRCDPKYKRLHNL
ncbi:uncharacterized protein LOC110238634 [Exaiptasia diaphana]|uniref:CRAL-TRIO domain-containing protein n=1 Tax=Exaiptasia diaphana TaxID=2652724 RepID=A0A913X7C6_EXADI|nr:uncharacterized protein LOC110238634 [Exaiptasia diaphana]KXJ28505.1 Protein prune-like 2 [Exaiptasia diaphana]